MSTEEHFVFQGWDTVELAEKYGTPLYLLSEKKLREKFGLVRSGFLEKYAGSRAVYASKAFLTVAMCRIVESEGFWLDVVSGGELYTAWKSDFPLERVYFHGNNKSPEELKMAVELGLGAIVVDNESEFEVLDEITRALNATQDILLRVSPGIDVKTHRYISTGHAGSKFGFPLSGEDLERVEDRVVSSPAIRLRGYHFHLGSQLYDTESYVMATDLVLDRIGSLKERLGATVTEINIGGGYGVPVTSTDGSVDISRFTTAVMKAIDEGCRSKGLEIPNVTIEPGRWIVSEAGITIYSAGFIKDIPGHVKYVSVDGGMTDNPRPALYGAKYEAVNASRFGCKSREKVTIVGKCCESGDILVRDIEMSATERGDIIAVLNTGAYTYSMANNYNLTPRPAVVLLGEKETDVIVERQSYKDLIRGQSIPDRLNFSGAK